MTVTNTNTKSNKDSDNKSVPIIASTQTLDAGQLIETDSDLRYLFFLASLSVYYDAEFCWLQDKAAITFSYTPEGISLDKLWVPIRYRHQHCGRAALLEFLRFFDLRKKAIPVFLTVAPLDSVTQAAKLIQFYRSCGFRANGFINALNLPEMIHGKAVVPNTVSNSNHDL